ncbi:hypothetical protein DK853_46505, partial [Klebsiella oxytoca]
ETEEGCLVMNLVELARKGEKIRIEEEEFDPAALLTLFIKRSLVLLNFITTPENIGALMFTVDHLDDKMVEILTR